jgi:hypothetical protein
LEVGTLVSPYRTAEEGTSMAERCSEDKVSVEDANPFVPLERPRQCARTCSFQPPLGEVNVDMVAYRGYSIDLRREASTWRFLATPTHSDLPIFSRAVSPQFSSREAALVDARKHIDHLLAG